MTVAQDDIEAVLGRALTDDENIWFPRLLEMAEGMLASALPGFSLSAGDEEVEVVATGNELWTPRYPVTAVNSISVGEGVLSATSYTWDEKGRIRFGTRAVLNSWEIEPFRTAYDIYTVDYDYGLDPLPADIAMVVAELVSGRFGSVPSGVTQETLGSYSVSYAQTDTQSAVQGLRYQLRHWRRTGFVSVPMEP